MAKAKVVHSGDACTIIVRGDINSPEPSTNIIKFPGGHVEVTRTSDGSYWVHLQRQENAEIVESRVDYNYIGGSKNGILDVPDHQHVIKAAFRIQGGDHG